VFAPQCEGAVPSEEASHIATVYRTLGGFPQPLQDDLKDSVVRYTQSIIEKAWPAQQRRGVTEEGIEIILHLWKRITQFEPTTSGQVVVHGQVLDNFNKLVEFRRRRIEAASYAVPGALWAVVLIGAAVSIFGSYLFKIESLWVHGLLTILLTTMIALLVFFIATTDHPYSGSNAIEPLATRSYPDICRTITNSRRGAGFQSAEQALLHAVGNCAHQQI
jgi:hypothetical protein